MFVSIESCLILDHIAPHLIDLMYGYMGSQKLKSIVAFKYVHCTSENEHFLGKTNNQILYSVIDGKEC